MYAKNLINKSECIRDQTLKVNIFSLVENYVQEFNKLNVMSSLQNGVIFREGLFESSILAETSFFLVIHGFYDEANAVLRQLLDDFVTRLYFDRLNERKRLKKWVDEGGRVTNEYNSWRLGSGGYPTKESIWCILLEEDTISRYDTRYNIKTEISEFMKELSKYIHNRPITRHYPGASRSSVCNIQFEKSKFDSWFDNIKKVYGLVLTISILLYPDILGIDLIFTKSDEYKNNITILKEIVVVQH